MVYHSKSLEILTEAQNILYTTNLEEDIEEIREKLQMLEPREVQQELAP
jgi:hypothetical protein